jgi:hypothetical protein
LDLWLLVNDCMLIDSLADALKMTHRRCLIVSIFELSECYTIDQQCLTWGGFT